jgi:hypothetical protein
MNWEQTKLGWKYEAGPVVVYLDGFAEEHAEDQAPSVERWLCCVSVQATDVGQPIVDHSQVYLAYEQPVIASGVEDAQRAAVLFATQVLRKLALSWNADASTTSH